MIRIVAPEFTPGRSTFLDVDFLDGVAEVDELHPVRAQALEQHGYVLTDEVGEVPSEDEVGGTAIVNLNDLTVPELRDLIGDRAEIPSKAKKADLVDIASRLPAEPIPGDVDNGDDTFTSPGIPSLLSEAGAEGAREHFIPDGAGDARNAEIIAATGEALDASTASSDEG